MISSRPAVLVVSKPLAPPWTDGSKNLAREIVRGLAALESPREAHAFLPSGVGGGDATRAHRTPTSELSKRTQASMLATLAIERGAGIWHFVFAPSARTKQTFGPLATLRGRRTVQTIASAPAPDVRLGDVVFADRVVVLSRATEARALVEGVLPQRLSRVPIAITPPPTPSERAIDEVRRRHALRGRFVVTFPGDLEHGGGAALLVDACVRMSARRDVTLVLACRDKTDRSRTLRAELTSRAMGRGLDVRMIGETPSIHALLAASDVVALPTQSLYAKVDHPLVLLEAMHLGRVVLVSEGTAAHELADEGGALGTAFDADAIAMELDRLISDRHARAEAAEAARSHATARTVVAMARAYDSIYDALTR